MAVAEVQGGSASPVSAEAKPKPWTSPKPKVRSQRWSGAPSPRRFSMATQTMEAAMAGSTIAAGTDQPPHTQASSVKAWPAVLLAGASGLMEPLGSLFGAGIAGGLALAYPVGLGLAAGAMIFVVSHEVIPETHRNGHQTSATLGLMAGFAVMMFLDTALG